MVNRSSKINVELGEKEAEGIYANLAVITHSPSQFILDFARVLPGSPKGKVYARIVMTPQHVKLLAQALEENIRKFEDQFGDIRISGGAEHNIGFQPQNTT